MTVRLLFTAAFAAALATASPASAFSGPRGTKIEPLTNEVFEVGARGSGKSDYLWCGAASYARRVLKADWRADIYVVRGRGKGEVTRQGVAAHFTLDPSAAGVKPIPAGQSFNTMAIGYSMSVQRANGLCSVPPDLFM